MSTIVRMEHIGLGVARERFEETLRFYEQIFGWHRIKENPGEMAFIGDGQGGRLELLPSDAPSLARPHHLAFVVDLDRFDAITVALRAGGASLQPESTNSFGDRLLFFTDPSGNWAQIVARGEPLAP